MPWDLDPAFLRRLEKRILVPMPSKDARKVMMQSHFSGLACTLTEENYDHLATLTEGFSGADIKLLCKEAAMRPVREILQQIESLDTRKNCSKSNPSDLQKMSLTLLSHYPLSMKHVEDSLTSTNHSVGSELCQKYILWSNKFGSH
jgi:katanin p60 ATPase-containing subunit A1